MSYEIVLQSEAIWDLQEAFEWYEKKRRGLGFEFIEEIESGYLKISKHPLHYPSINTQFRRIRINRFPYLVIYEIEGNSVIINSVRHVKREPKY
jgi:toxin ParE1/3/4